MSGKIEGSELTEEIIRENLSCLGRHPFYSRHAYLGLRATDLGLNSVERISQFPHLMFVNIAGNKVENLKPLENLIGLVQLNASNNKLKKCLDFAPKRCVAGDAWSGGHKAVGSMLAMADVSGNEITEIGDLSRHIFLETLSLRSNQIERISGIHQLKYLQVLDLSYNRIKKIEGLDGLLISELNLEGNRLVTISGLENLSRLSALNISNNQIRSLGPLRKCEKLHNLNAQNNKISKIRQVEFLKDLQWLQHLQLTGNSCCGKPFYRARVAFRLSQLQALDLVAVSSEEKIRAYNLYGTENGDLPHRQEVFSKYFPGEPFQNYTPLFEDDEHELDEIQLYEEGVGEVFITEEELAAVRAVALGFVDDVLTSSMPIQT